MHLMSRYYAFVFKSSIIFFTNTDKVLAWFRYLWRRNHKGFERDILHRFERYNVLLFYQPIYNGLVSSKVMIFQTLVKRIYLISVIWKPMGKTETNRYEMGFLFYYISIVHLLFHHFNYLHLFHSSYRIWFSLLLHFYTYKLISMIPLRHSIQILALKKYYSGILCKPID